MAKPVVLFSMEIAHDIKDRSYGAALINTLQHTSEKLMPEQLSWTENFKDKFISIEDFTKNWWAGHGVMRLGGEPAMDVYHGPSWRRRSSIVNRGMVLHLNVSSNNITVPATIWFEVRWRKDIPFFRLFQHWVDIFSPSTAMLHLFQGPELSPEEGSAATDFRVGSFGGPARPGLPDLGWCMGYDQDAFADIDFDLLSSHGFRVERIGGVQIVRMTDSLSDVVDDFTAFEQRRELMKTLLPADMLRTQSHSGD